MNTIYKLLFAIVLISCVLKVRTPRNEKFIGVAESKPKMYGRDSCPYCVKMKSQLKQDNVWHLFEYIDVTTSDGVASFQAVNGTVVPLFECNGIFVIGSTSTQELLEKLKI
uniref:Glutaredoxin domain-containing protein n=1 Tax=viral metagenome TaxID=1070528 RepID=A0A6C0F804_9ZZZZ|tara:strand:- start:4178 stop:4510 length:333 start_codon:yes stop_codon:yes gene_type:complete